MIAWQRSACGVVLTGLSVAAAGATLAAAAFAIARPQAIDYAEPVVYGQALRLVSGEPLYQPIDGPHFTVAAYTPLYYWLAAALMTWSGPGFGPGRALSLAAGASSSILVGVLAARRGAAWWTGPFASLLFLALAFPRPDTPWLGLYRVDMLGVALSLAAVLTLSRARTVRADLAAGVLAGVALLTKQTLFAALIAGGVWRWRRSGPYVATVVATFLAPCIVLELTSGAFVQDTVLANANPYYLTIAGGLLKEFIKAQWLPLVLAGAYLVLDRPWRDDESRLLVLYWASSSVSLALLGNIGANHNYWLEFAAATAVLAARGATCLVNTVRRAFAVALILLVGLAFGGPPGLVDSVRTTRSNLQYLGTALPDTEFSGLVERVRNAQTEVIGEPMDVVVLAGRQVLLEPFIYNLLLDEGRWRPDALVTRICNGDVGLVILGYTLEVAARMTDGLHALWPPPVIASLQATMSLEGEQAGRYVYTLRMDNEIRLRARSTCSTVT